MLLLLMLMLMLLVLVHVPLDALLAQQLGPLLAIAKGGIEGVRVTAAATRATAEATAQRRRLFNGIDGSLLENKGRTEKYSLASVSES